MKLRACMPLRAARRVPGTRLSRGSSSARRRTGPSVSADRRGAQRAHRLQPLHRRLRALEPAHGRRVRAPAERRLERARAIASASERPATSAPGPARRSRTKARAAARRSARGSRAGLPPAAGFAGAPRRTPAATVPRPPRTSPSAAALRTTAASPTTRAGSSLPCPRDSGSLPASGGVRCATHGIVASSVGAVPCRRTRACSAQSEALRHGITK